jgi:phasin family protein
MAEGSKKDPTSDFIAVSEEMRKFTQASVEQARNAFNDFLEATTKTMGEAETKGQAFQKEARKLSMGSVEYAQSSLEASFAFAARMAQAKDVNELLELQKSYLEEQFKAAQSEMQRVSDTASKMAAELTPDKPKK